MRLLANFFALAALAVAGGASTVHFTCTGESQYGEAICAYEQGDVTKAEALFDAIVQIDAPEPETLKAVYFRARCRMALGRPADAAADLMRIYAADTSFYHEWGCDFLLGEARRSMGME